MGDTSGGETSGRGSVAPSASSVVDRKESIKAAESLAPVQRYRVASESDTDDEEVHSLKDYQKEEMAKLMAKHQAELKVLKEKRQKKKQAELANINKQLRRSQND